MDKKRVTYPHRNAFAGCHVCNGSDAIWFSKNAQAIAARHHDATGHPTWIESSLLIQYGELL